MVNALAVVFSLLFSFLAASTDGYADEAQYRLGPGDRLRVTVFRHSDLSGEFEVDGRGLISLPLAGPTEVGGKTLEEAEATIVDALKPQYLRNPRVNVDVLNYRPFYILGEVNGPGRYSYVNGITVLEAVAIAGGFTYRARKSEMTIIRATDPERVRQPATPETIVLPGDVINVPQRFF